MVGQAATDGGVTVKKLFHFQDDVDLAALWNLQDSFLFLSSSQDLRDLKYFFAMSFWGIKCRLIRGWTEWDRIRSGGSQSSYTYLQMFCDILMPKCIIWKLQKTSCNTAWSMSVSKVQCKIRYLPKQNSCKQQLVPLISTSRSNYRKHCNLFAVPIFRIA